MTKDEACRLFGGRPIDLARACRITRQAVNSWGEVLTIKQLDRVQAAILRKQMEAAPARKSSRASVRA